MMKQILPFKKYISSLFKHKIITAQNNCGIHRTICWKKFKKFNLKRYVKHWKFNW